jgi:hypothetical protein
VAHLVVVHDSRFNPNTHSGDVVSDAARCSTGHLIGGGASVTSTHGIVALRASRPNGQEWLASGIRTNSSGSMTVDVYAICAS